MIPQIGNLRASNVRARRVFSALSADTSFNNGKTTDTGPARRQTFITVAVAYTYPGMIVVTDPPPDAGLPMNVSRLTAARIADNSVPSVRVTTTMVQIRMVCVFVFTFESSD